jgi:hypothetical protein
VNQSVAGVTIGTRDRSLPADFQDLQDLVEWALPTEEERYRKRMNSSIEDLADFYARVRPRAAAARDFLDQYGPDALPVDAQRLLWLLFSMITASYAVDVFAAPRVPDTGSAYVLRVGEPSAGA